MKLIELARTYKAVQEHFPRQFQGAEIATEHDLLYIILEKPTLFSDKDLEFLNEIGFFVEDTEDSDNHVVSFYIYI